MTPQIEKCAARMPQEQRAEFLRLLDQSASFLAVGWRMRRQAWEMYRSATGRTKREATK